MARTKPSDAWQPDSRAVREWEASEALEVLSLLVVIALVVFVLLAVA